MKTPANAGAIKCGEETIETVDCYLSLPLKHSFKFWRNRGGRNGLGEKRTINVFNPKQSLEIQQHFLVDKTKTKDFFLTPASKLFSWMEVKLGKPVRVSCPNCNHQEEARRFRR